MELEVRNKKGNMFAQFKGEAASLTFLDLLRNKEMFTFTTKKYKEGDVPIFISTQHAILLVNMGVQLWLEPDDYIKVIS